MSLVYSAITPHPPLLIPNIGKDKTEELVKTKKALEEIEQNLYLSKPHLIIIITPHEGIYDDTFVVNAHTTLQSHFQEFGDMETKKSWSGAPSIAAKIQHKTREENIATRLISNEELGHGASVPLFFLTSHLPNVQVLPLGYSKTDAKSHLLFGEILKEVIMNSEKRIALIASGDLSHRLTTNSPGGFHKDGQKFDDKIIELLETHNTTGFVGLDPDMVANADDCAYRSILIALGVLKNMNYTFKNLCYESPFGVGYLTGEFGFD